MLGYNSSELLEKYHSDFSESIHPDDLLIMRQTMNAVVDTGIDGKYSIGFRRKDGIHIAILECQQLFIANR